MCSCTFRRSSAIKRCPAFESNWVSANEVTPCVAVASSTTRTSFFKSSMWCLAMTKSIRYLVEYGSTNPETRLMIIRKKLKTSSQRRGRTSSQRSGRTARKVCLLTLRLAGWGELGAIELWTRMPAAAVHFPTQRRSYGRGLHPGRVYPDKIYPVSRGPGDASACWTDNYVLGMLMATSGSDLLDLVSWKESPKPVFHQSPENGSTPPATTCSSNRPLARRIGFFTTLTPRPARIAVGAALHDSLSGMQTARRREQQSSVREG